MLNPELCENCNERESTIFATYVVAGREVKVALCGACGAEELPRDLANQKRSQLPSEEKHSQSKKMMIFVVVQFERCDDGDGSPSDGTPIAAFLHRENADRFLDWKRSQAYLHLDWEIVSTPLEDQDA